MLHLILCKDWIAGRDAVLDQIAMDVRQRKGGRILMVPELISHDMERRLCTAAGDTASRYAEVLSFTRLARRVADGAGSAAQECLDNGGRVVAMAAAARQLHSKLKAYAAVETKPEFLSGLIDAIDEFKRCCISSTDLQFAAQATEGSLSQKLEELALMMEAYDSLCARGKRDPRDQMTWCLEQMEVTDFAREHVFYIDGFPDFTRQHMAILAHLIQESPSVTVCLNCDTPETSALAFEKAGDTARDILRIAEKLGTPAQVSYIGSNRPLANLREQLFQGNIVTGSEKENLKLFRAESAYAECMGAAQEILELVRSGCRYRDITLVCTDMNVYQPLINLIFHRMHIPVYQSGTEDILQKSVVTTVLTALDAALTGFDQRNVLRYLRSALSPLEPDICDEVENYSIIWGIRGLKWTQKWENHPDGLSGIWDERSQERLDLVERARKRTMDPLNRLRLGFAGAKNLRQQVLALYSFLEEIDLERHLSDLAEELDAGGDNRSAQILNQLWEILMSALEQMHDVLGETIWEPELFTRLLRLLLSQYDVGTIPPVLDAVQMGPVSAMRCHQEKHLILLGAQEGNLPGYTGSSGILTDQERVALRELGVPLTGGAMEGIQAEFAEIYGVFCGATEHISVYCSGEQPSFVFRRLSLLAGGEGTVAPDLGYALGDREEAGAFLARWHAGDAARRLGLETSYEDIQAKQNYSLGAVARENIEKLYGKTLHLSASRIDRQAECRFSYFMKYGLRAQERKEATVDPAEFGTYVHAVLENTARCIQDMGGFHQVSLEQTLEIAHQYSEEYAKERFAQIDSDRLSYLFRRNTQELDMVVRELWQELKESLFQPAGFEVNFGGAAGLPPIHIPNGSMQAVLRGFIDRMDTWVNGSTTYYRVVDYKTGRKEFDYCDVYNGVGLQMLLYMFALRGSGEVSLGEHPVPAGVQYFPARAPYLSSDGNLSAEEAEKIRSKEWKRRGLLLRDTEVLHAMEPEDGPGRMCYTVKKDGSLSGDLAEREELQLLEQYIFRFLGKMVEDIASGNVIPNPYTRGTSHSACAFCPYGSVCHEAEVEGRRNYKTMSSQRFWEEIGKELSGNG